MTEEPTTIEGWMLVEIFGHQQYVGYVTTVMMGNAAFLRVDAPAVDDQPAYTKFFGPGAIYSLTPVTEELARLAIRQLRPEALAVVRLPKQLPAAAYEEAASPEDYEDPDDLQDWSR